MINREEANGLTVIQQSQKGYIDKVISCIENGRPLLLENLPDDIDAVLDSVVGKQTMKRGQNLVIKIGDNEVDYDKNFRLYLQTKLSNPHYKPEINAQVGFNSVNHLLCLQFQGYITCFRWYFPPMRCAGPASH